MRNSTAFFSILLVFVYAAVITTAAQAPGQTSLIGNWELQGAREGGMGSVYTFRPDGALVITSSLMLDFQAQAKGDEVLARVAGEKGGAQSVRIRASGDSLTYLQKGQPQSWVRLGTPVPGQPAFAGLWAVDQSAPSERRKNDEIAQLIRQNMRLKITPASASTGTGPEWNVRIRCPIENSGGSYTVQGNRVVMMYNGKVLVATFRLEGNKLYLTRHGDNAQTVFERAD
ncbi:MAG: hypothetical protein ACE14M_02865 [Terriglobales bacterium]